MGNEQSGCFRANSIGKSRVQLYDMGRVVHNNDQVKMNQESKGFIEDGEKVHKNKSMSCGKIHECIFEIQKKLVNETQQNWRENNGNRQFKSDNLNEENMQNERVKKKMVLCQEIISQIGSLQGKNSTQTNDSQRPSMMERILERKQDSFEVSQVSLTHFNLPLETIVKQSERNDQNKKRNRSNERQKDRRNLRSKQRKSERSNQRENTVRLNVEQRLNVQENDVQKQKRKRKNDNKRRQQRSKQGDDKNRKVKKGVSLGGERIKKVGQQYDGKKENKGVIQVMNRLNRYGL